MTASKATNIQTQTEIHRFRMMLGFLGFSAHGDSKGSSEQPKNVKRTLMAAPRGSPGRRRTAPRGPGDGPRAAQDSPRAPRWPAQEGCKMALEGPSRALKWPGGANGTPRWPWRARMHLQDCIFGPSRTPAEDVSGILRALLRKFGMLQNYVCRILVCS